jgi:NhaA family Na+:H+ antiporter
LISGPLSWWGFFVTGLHPALALIPIVPFLRHAPRSVDLLAVDAHERRASREHFEQVFRGPVQVILFFFALVNAGALMRGVGTGTWAVLVGSLVGRPVGILVGAAIAVLAGLRLPEDVGWRQLVVVAFAGSIGVTFAVFFATGVYPVGPVLMEAKLGALATATGMLLTIVVAWILGVGRFARPRKFASLRGPQAFASPQRASHHGASPVR